jgi:hypothetical protein
MADKKIVINYDVEDESDVWHELLLLTTITHSQRMVAGNNVLSELPCKLIVEQRSAYGPINVRTIGAKGERVFKITQRAKIRESYVVL